MTHYLFNSLPVEIRTKAAHDLLRKNYKELQRVLPDLEVDRTFMLLKAEIAWYKRPTFINRIRQRLRAAVVEELDQAIDDLIAINQPTGEEN